MKIIPFFISLVKAFLNIFNRIEGKKCSSYIENLSFYNYFSPFGIGVYAENADLGVRLQPIDSGRSRVGSHSYGSVRIGIHRYVKGEKSVCGKGGGEGTSLEGALSVYGVFVAEGYLSERGAVNKCRFAHL